MMSCSKKNTLLSFNRPIRLPSGSDTMNVSCRRRRPWATIFPWIRTRQRLFRSRVVTVYERHYHIVKWSYIESLKATDVQHVVAPFWHDAHDFHRFLLGRRHQRVNRVFRKTVYLNGFKKYGRLFKPLNPRAPVRPFSSVSGSPSKIKGKCEQIFDSTKRAHSIEEVSNS